ncbi:MAG TPA: L-threonylcarbamoyladenylate synthase [Hyphomicrobiaceae bacterium]|jgi:L-threonylcarbamoyladenylate synthase
MAVMEATPEAIAAAGAALRGGALVAFPTETVYGLGANAGDGRAVAAIFAAKGRPRFNPLIVHVADVDRAERLGSLTDAGRQLAAHFWPGALTLVVAKRPRCRVAELATAGLATVALRVPAHPIARALLRATDRPVAAPSANRSGHVSATTAAHVAADLGASVSIILDGGPTPIGLESTVVDATGAEPVILRLGGVARESLESVLSRPLALARGAPGRPASPGMLTRHYAPATKLRLDAVEVRPGEALLAFGPAVPKCAAATVNLSPSGDLVEAAANLFSALRELDTAGATAIAVMPIPRAGLGEAINDRLQRAARSR